MRQEGQRKKNGANQTESAEQSEIAQNGRIGEDEAQKSAHGGQAANGHGKDHRPDSRLDVATVFEMSEKMYRIVRHDAQDYRSGSGGDKRHFCPDKRDETQRKQSRKSNRRRNEQQHPEGAEHGNQQRHDAHQHHDHRQSHILRYPLRIANRHERCAEILRPERGGTELARVEVATNLVEPTNEFRIVARFAAFVRGSHEDYQIGFVVGKQTTVYHLESRPGLHLVQARQVVEGKSRRVVQQTLAGENSRAGRRKHVEIFRHRRVHSLRYRGMLGDGDERRKIARDDGINLRKFVGIRADVEPVEKLPASRFDERHQNVGAGYERIPVSPFRIRPHAHQQLFRRLVFLGEQGEIFRIVGIAEHSRNILLERNSRSRQCA